MVDHPQLPPDQVAEVRKITLPQGGELEVTMTPQFIAVLRQHYGLFGDQPLDDDHVRMYVWGSLNGAVDKAEREMKQDAKPAANPSRVRRPRRRKEGQGS
jgi:hypothetical protein